ncbi:ovochymase-2 [Rhynchonycteris naso]
MLMSKNKLVLLLGMICLKQSNSATLSLSKAPSCGQSLVKAQPWNYLNIFSRIVGGNQVVKGSYPWQVSLKRRQKHICGGTIISPQWVITAAHCVANRNTASILNVIAGKHDLSQTEPGEQNLTIESIIIHPNFSIKKPMNYDIALLKMAGTFHFGQFMGPVCLPEPGEQFKAGLICTTAGWGRLTEDGILPQVLQEVNLPILTQEECVAALLTLKKPISGQTILCTGFPDGGRDACQGDSGGSLMCRNEKGGWTLAGVTSWGLGCGRGWRNNAQKDDQGSPGIFTDLSKVLPWIHKHIQIGNKTRKQRKLSRASCSEKDRVVSESEAELHFPESPDLYSDSTQLCVWTLLAPEAMHVLLRFSHLDAESCLHNYLSLYSLEDRLIGKFCGKSLASSVLVASNSLRLKFISDATDFAAGFNLTYKALKPNYRPDSGCSSLTVLFEEGLIQSLHYPEDYSDMANCNWVFQAPKHYLIKLSFQNLEVEENGDCTSDYVTVHRDVERKKEIVRFCGFVAPAPVLSSSGVMFISFQSDENVTFRGFQATVAFIPETDLNISRSEDESMLLEAWNVLPEESNAFNQLFGGISGNLRIPRGPGAEQTRNHSPARKNPPTPAPRDGTGVGVTRRRRSGYAFSGLAPSRHRAPTCGRGAAVGRAELQVGGPESAGLLDWEPRTGLPAGRTATCSASQSGWASRAGRPAGKRPQAQRRAGAGQTPKGPRQSERGTGEDRERRGQGWGGRRGHTRRTRCGTGEGGVRAALGIRPGREKSEGGLSRFRRARRGREVSRRALRARGAGRNRRQLQRPARRGQVSAQPASPVLVRVGVPRSAKVMEHPQAPM